VSIGHRLEDWELGDTSLYDLYHALGANDTPLLFDQPYEISFAYDWPAAGGMSLDRSTVYIDRTLYQEVMDGELKATGLEPEQLINCWIQHERVENAIITGDNPVDNYWPAHNRALAAEHEIYRIFNCDPVEVEKAIWPALVRCYKRPIKKPPLDAWCGVYNYEAGAEDEAILEQLLRLDVIDARKRSKHETSYGLGGRRCDSCRNRDKKVLNQGPIFGCSIVSGSIREDRSCQFWMPDDDPTVGIEEGTDKLSQSTVDYTDKGHSPELCDRCLHWQAVGRCEIVKGEISPKGWCRLFHK
jgi:hypothetical protein